MDRYDSISAVKTAIGGGENFIGNIDIEVEHLDKTYVYKNVNNGFYNFIYENKKSR